MVTEIPAAEWRKLIHVAQRYAAVRPWEWIQDAQVFGVVDPDTLKSVYCSIMGHSGEMKALALYPGKEGWKSYLAIGAEDMDTDPSELVYGQNCLILSFDAPQEAEADDLALLKHVGVAVDDTSLVPSFRSYRPGYLPQPPNLEELRFMQRIVSQVLALVGDLPGSGEFLSEDGLNDEGKLLFRVPDGEGWKMEWRKPDSTLDFSPAILTLDHDDLQKARKLPQKQAIWLLEDFHLPEPVLNEDEVAFFPRAFVFFDLEVQEFRGISLLQPGDFPDVLGSLLVEMMEQQKMVPTQMVVSKKTHLNLMRPFCQSLGIGIHLEESLDILADLREAVQEMMGDSAQ